MLVVGLSMVGCGPVESPLTAGTYVLAAGQEPAGTLLAVDVEAKRVTLTRPSAEPVALTLTPVARRAWARGCPTNYTSVALETFDVTPRPLVVGGATLEAPQLLAGCGLDAANADEVSLESGGVKLRFERR